MSAMERTYTGCSDQGALQLKRRRPNEHSAMSAKHATQTAGPTFASQQAAPKAHGSNVLASTSQVLGNHHPQAPHAVQVMGTQPILLRLPMVIRNTGLARSTIYKLISQNQFPVPIKLSKRAVAWLQSEVVDWIASRARTH